MKCGVNIWLWTVLRLWVLLAAWTFAPFASSAYDGLTRSTGGYDAPKLSAIGYDAAPALATNEEQGRGGGMGILRAEFAGFLAAESGAGSAAQGAMLRTQLAAEEAAGAQLPQSLTGYTRHGLNQAISRDGVGVSPQAILDAWKNPVNLTGQTRGRFLMEGQNATIAVNSQGQVISTWADGSAGLRLKP